MKQEIEITKDAEVITTHCNTNGLLYLTPGTQTRVLMKREWFIDS